MWLISVDAAAKEIDPLKRIAFVAAFAMSNYSSTIGRIAKPFNPMLVSRSSTHCPYP
jgi:oxysterol-binding protein 1